MRRRACLAFILFFFFLLAGCREEPKASFSPPPLKLVAATYFSPSSLDCFPPVRDFVEYVNQKGAGKVQIEFYHSALLLQPEELAAGLLKGDADLIFSTETPLLGTFPCLGVNSLPFFYASREEAAQKLKMGAPLYNLLNAELAKQDAFLLATFPLLPENLWLVRKPGSPPEILAGTAVRVSGERGKAVVSCLGGVPVVLPATSLYRAFREGEVEGLLAPPTIAFSRSLPPFFGFWVTGYFGGESCGIYMRLSRWQELPEEVRSLFLEAARRYEEEGLAWGKRRLEDEYLLQAKKLGIKLVSLKPEEEEALAAACRPVWEAWKKKVPPDFAAQALSFASRPAP